VLLPSFSSFNLWKRVEEAMLRMSSVAKRVHPAELLPPSRSCGSPSWVKEDHISRLYFDGVIPFAVYRDALDYLQGGRWRLAIHTLAEFASIERVAGVIQSLSLSHNGDA
jgi:hypothetical protein